LTAALGTLALVGGAVSAQQPNTAPGRSRYDVTNYRIEAQLIPAQHLLRAGADVTVNPLDATRSIVFEFNGSLKIDAVERNGKPVPNFVQDAVGADSLGPNVRIDLGEVVPVGTPITLRFMWSGPLITAEGGPLPTKRLAYIGEEGSYLMYASRWFPFHDYAVDRATSDITIVVPNGTQVAGVSDDPVVPSAAGKDGNTRYHFVQRKPTLLGNFVAGKYITKTLHYGGYELEFDLKLGSENRAERYGELIGQALEFYTKQYGTPDFGKRLVIAQIDDDSLDTYATQGMMFLSNRLFDPNRPTPDERLQREVAYQWWGQTVGLKSFDDAWVSQGLAQWSTYALRETILSDAQLDSALRELQERALTFEQTASIARAPANLDDQSAAYQSIVFYKGAMVFSMLRQTLGKEKFDRLLQQFLQQYRGKNASIDDFEKLTDQVSGESMRFFFARWVEGTGVPEFSAEYQIIRTRSGKFIARGTAKQTYENLHMPVQVMLRSEGGNQTTTLFFDEQTADFNFESQGQPIEVIVDPNNRILRTSDDLRVAAIARRAIEQYREGNYAEAQQQFEAALKLDANNPWVLYNFGMLLLEQRNYEQAKDKFKSALNRDNPDPVWIRVWARIKLGNAYDASGDRMRAVFQYKEAKKAADDLDNNYDNAKSAIEKYLASAYDPRATQAALPSGAQ
jgi:aminopeptidase N